MSRRRARLPRSPSSVLTLPTPRHPSLQSSPTPRNDQEHCDDRMRPPSVDRTAPATSMAEGAASVLAPPESSASRPAETEITAWLRGEITPVSLAALVWRCEEPGENPGRSRHCDRGATPRKPRPTGRKAGQASIRESGDSSATGAPMTGTRDPEEVVVYLARVISPTLGSVAAPSSLSAGCR